MQSSDEKSNKSRFSFLESLLKEEYKLLSNVAGSKDLLSNIDSALEELSRLPNEFKEQLYYKHDKLSNGTKSIPDKKISAIINYLDDIRISIKELVKSRPFLKFSPVPEEEERPRP